MPRQEHQAPVVVELLAYRRPVLLFDELATAFSLSVVAHLVAGAVLNGRCGLATSPGCAANVSLRREALNWYPKKMDATKSGGAA